MKIMSTIENGIEKGHIAIILDENEVADFIKHAKGLSVTPSDKKIKPPVKKSPLQGLHGTNKEFIKGLYSAYGEGTIIKLTDTTFISIRKFHFIVNLTHILRNLNKRGVITYDEVNRSFMFIKNPIE